MPGKKKEKKIMLASRQKVQSDNNTSNVNADDNAIAIADNDNDDDDADDHYHSVLRPLCFRCCCCCILSGVTCYMSAGNRKNYAYAVCVM